MIQYNREIVNRDLTENEEIMQRYEEASQALFRANESKSVTCHALWALNRRQIRPLGFESRVLEGEYPERFETESSNEFERAIRELRRGNNDPGEIFDTNDLQKANIDLYIQAGTQVFDELIEANWDQHTNNENVRPNAGVFYRNYYHSMNQWRWALKNVAI